MTDAFESKRWETGIGFLFPDVASWTRLEPQSVNGNPALGLAATVADPLWMLARQWQFGEFVAEDAGTPLSVEIGISASSVSSSLFSGDDSETLSATIEHDPPPAPDRLSRARAGRELLAALRAAGFADVADAMLSEVRWSAPDTPEKAWAAVAPVLAPRSVDAEAVRDRLAGRADGPLPGADRPEVRAVVESWLRGYDAKHHPGESFAWSGPRLEYRYTLSAPSPEGGVHLHATEADDGTPRWWSVDTSSSLGGRPPATSSHRSLATPLRYPGMPADRLWEFEDAQVNLGALEVQPHDLARLLVVECAMVYGCDWLNIAIDVPAGALIQITSVRYRNTFGDTISVSHRPTPWQMYTMSPLPGQPPTAGLLTSPVGGARLEGPAVEEVLFLRDEAANLVWGVERTVPDELGRPMPRTAGYAGPTDAVVSEPDPGSELRYRLQSSVPQWWVPYIPQLTTRDGSIGLELARGRVLGAETAVRGTTLTGADHEVLFDAEVPRDGVRVRRVPVLARRSDGTYASWIARRVSVGRGEGRSSLEFDATMPIRPTEDRSHT